MPQSDYSSFRSYSSNHIIAHTTQCRLQVFFPPPADPCARHLRERSLEAKPHLQWYLDPSLQSSSKGTKAGDYRNLGRDPVKLTPGLNLNIPFYHEATVVDMRESSVNIPNLPAYTADNVPVICSGSLFYRVNDSYRATFAVSEVQKNVQNIGTSAVRSVLGTFTYDEVISDRNGLNTKLNKVIGSSIATWGVECTRFEIQSFQPANREVERQLELQMEAERNRRKQLLDTQAQINVAEGQKQRVILESEGHLAAKANEADASYKTLFREAEARQQQSLMEASALAQQVDHIARSLASNPDNVTPEDRKLALTTLVELRRLEQLRAIANGQGNSTYFFGEKAEMRSASEYLSTDYSQSLKGVFTGDPGLGQRQSK
ncbi:hypothetical protein D9619_010596 [Psilocybe cf. subviscida]|uniref:Band 7 domain-containing protein n=1 Tax=Psilocybe cf. subviscida TaxID=2480587 RepID=A0A8H5ASQ7_9AGAR|nr:hypothetical protein D9619_010596 [Psilocybe cf. subviscida]